MSAYRFLSSFLLLTAGAVASAAEQPATEFTLSEPYTAQNLAIYLIQGKNAIAGKNFLTLQEALEQKKMIVRETGTVNQLAVENISKDEEIYIQSGDIVKGGKQDRVIGHDMIVSARSGPVPISSFCVEQGRWRGRGSEAADHFSASSGQLPGRGLRLAVNSARQQGQVWEQVKEQQEKLSKKLSSNVADMQSPSSLQLTLENKELQKEIDRYIDKLSKCLEGKDDVIGFVMTINGRVEGGEIYGSSALFRKMWPKMLRAAAVDAFGDLQKGKKFEAAEMETVKAFLADTDKGRPVESKVNERIRVLKCDGDISISIESRDQEQKGGLIHRAYIAK